MSAAIRFRLSRPRMIVRSSRVDQPPVSGVPVAGATGRFVSGQNKLKLEQDRGCGREGRTSRIECVDVKRQVDRVLGTDSLDDLLDDTIRADLVDLTRLDDLESAVPVVLIVAGAAERRADASVDVGVVAQQALLRGVVEVGAVVDAGHLGRGAAEHLRAPGVEMAVEVDYRHGAIGAVDGAEQRQGDGVVTTERDDAGQGLAVLGRTFLPGVGLGRAGKEGVVAFLDLVEGVGVVVPVFVSARNMCRARGECPYEVTGMSPQSSTVAQLLKGLVSRGTL
jgi:hypothetical protein